MLSPLPDADIFSGRTHDASQGELPASHPLHQPHAQQGEQEVGQCGQSSQPDRQPVIPHSRHLEDGGAVIPGGTFCFFNVSVSRSNLHETSYLIDMN